QDFPMEIHRRKNCAPSGERLPVLAKSPVRQLPGSRQYASIRPGPGKYGRHPCTGIKDHDFTKYTEPAYTMRVKSYEKMQDIYSYILWSCKEFRFPSIYFWLAEIIPTPAPNEYYVEKIHPIEEPNAPAYTIGVRTCYCESSPTPGPNKYTLPGTLGPGLVVKPSAPCLTMASSASVWSYAKDLVKGPGPAMHARPEPNVYLHRQPAYSISQKLNPPSKDYMPGPLDYNAELVMAHKPRAPRFSLGIRHSEYTHTTPPVCIVKE
uniref:Ciliary microtubule associated protein 1C n=1 Tax=Anolis carolinensis TaxID=28377 RepID=H9GN23_ANOCA